MSVGDFNGDGIQDIVAANLLDSTASILLGNGDGSFQARTTSTVGAGASSLRVGDFNGDGIQDLVVAGSTLDVLLGNGDGTFAARKTLALGLDPETVSIGDLNGDGVLDLITANHADNSVSVLLGKLNDGASAFSVAPLLPFSLETQVAARQALPVFKRKIAQLAEQRGTLGAFQSRVEVVANTLRAEEENFHAAAGRIRDADIAEESANLVRLNIARQASVAVLAQANQQPGLALQLLS